MSEQVIVLMDNDGVLNACKTQQFKCSYALPECKRIVSVSERC